VDADRTRKQMLGVPETERIDDPAWRGAYDPAFTEKVYDEVLRRADVVLSSGRPVVLDATFRARSLRARARELAIRHYAPFRFVECQAPDEVCRRRLRERERERGVSDGRLELFDELRSRWEPVTELAPLEHLTVDTSRPLDDTLREVARSVDLWPKGLVA
jgi:hypothetical protein